MIMFNNNQDKLMSCTWMKTITYVLKGFEQLQYLGYKRTNYLDKLHWDNFKNYDICFDIYYNA